MVCGNFILPEPANYVFFYAFFNLCKLLYIIECSAFHRGMSVLEASLRNTEDSDAIISGLLKDAAEWRIKSLCGGSCLGSGNRRYYL